MMSCSLVGEHGPSPTYAVFHTQMWDLKRPGLQVIEA